MYVCVWCDVVVKNIIGEDDECICFVGCYCILCIVVYVYNWCWVVFLYYCDIKVVGGCIVIVVKGFIVYSVGVGG